MDSQDIKTENKQTKHEAESTSSCRKHVNVDDNASFYANLKDHINEFINASMDEHKSCLKNTFNKMFGISKAKVEAKEVESQAPLQAADST